MDWVKWALGEAALRTIIATLVKIVGGLATSVAGIALSTLVIGVTQMIVPGAVLWLKQINPFPSTQKVIGSLLFGSFAFANSMLFFGAFMLGADLGIYVFLTLLAIVPMTLIDIAFFKEKINIRQATGIILAITAGWFVLNTPNLAALMTLPLWAWLAIVNAFGNAVNQGITRWIKDIDTWVKNFWGGLATAVWCVVALILIGDEMRHALLMTDLSHLLFWSGAVAVVIIAMWSFNVLAYRSGASIPVKTIVVNGSYLVGSVLVGFILFSETLYMTQLIGALLYIGAFILINTTAWNYITNKHV